jgi:Flp pilus assembly CpaE family ATPase/methylmalonyl-CoA mutase cobalamin-binding subunit
VSPPVTPLSTGGPSSDVLPVFTAVTGAWEAVLVSGLERAGGDVVVVRRCVDLADLLAAAVTGQAQAVVLSADLRRLDGEALSHLASSGVAVVGLVEPGDEPAERRLRQLGVAEVLAVDTPAAEVADAVARAVSTADAQRLADPESGWGTTLALADPSRALPSHRAVEAAESEAAAADGSAAARGCLVAVWGPTGAPGRTTVAVTLAAELAALGHPTILADADTYGGSVAQVLGLLDEAPGLAAAARAADHGTLDLDQLARSAPLVAPGLRVLTGIVSPARWPELRAPALARVFALARVLSPWVVVDCGFALEQDEELTYDTAAPRRNGATLVALEQADVVVAVGSADPIGLQRLVRGLAELAELAPECHPVVVVNRVRGSAVGGSADSRVRDALSRYAGVQEPVLVPDDQPALDAALLAGRTLTESAPSSPARRALAALAATLVARWSLAERPSGR